ncbi:MAG TPA: sigma-70 family RNA polymerase sigma factor [Streptosporangiaceae bacterium]|nr:sigma-70 family RNA polymerase sigma factor [Streptosporangiaceae bacterium]
MARTAELDRRQAPTPPTPPRGRTDDARNAEADRAARDVTYSRNERGAPRKGAEMPNNDDFQRLADPFRRELLAHCYRMLGSVHDAEDLVQETYLRAWRAYDRFEGRSSLRTWLYSIATRTCLTALEQRNRRPMPSDLVECSDSPGGQLTTAPEVAWLEPIPDAFTTDPAAPADPAAIVASRESLRLALITALQHLPPRQRAVLLLRDVLKWRAAEVAELLGTSTAAINSALQRARAQLEEVAPSEDEVVEPTDRDQREMLDRYVAAFENADIAALVELFKQDAVWEMPPFLSWFRGRDNIGVCVSRQCAPGAGDLRLVPTKANGQPAFGLYKRRDDGVHRAHSLQVLTISSEGITHVGAFFDISLFGTFGLPDVYSGRPDVGSDQSDHSSASPMSSRR